MATPPYGMLPARAALVDQRGHVTREWWRWFESIFTTTGSGQASVDLASLANMQFLDKPSQGADAIAADQETRKQIVLYRPTNSATVAAAARSAADALLYQALGKFPDGAIAALERRIQMLEAGAAGRLFGGMSSSQALAAIASGFILGNPAAGSAVPVGSSISTMLDVAFGTTRGSVLFRSAALWTLLTPGVAGTFLESQGPGADVQWAGVGPGGGSSITSYVVNGTYSYSTPAGTNWLAFVGFGAGGGGGGAVGAATSNNRQGGSGGGGGARTHGIFPASAFSSPITVVVGKGGTGGTGGTGGNPSGGDAQGGFTTFGPGPEVFAGGGGRGSNSPNTSTQNSGGGGGGSRGSGGGGSTSNAVGGLPTNTTGPGISGQGAGITISNTTGNPAEHGGGSGGVAGTGAAGTGGQSIYGGGGGGGGGSLTSGNVLNAAGAGGLTPGYNTSGGGGGTAGVASNGGNGNPGNSAHGGNGGGGGAGNGSATGFNGGNGGFPGGGGGGGGGGTNVGGNGGNGADGAGYVIAW